MNIEQVIRIHFFILAHEPGLYVPPDAGRVSSVLSRIENAKLYENIEDTYTIAALYAISISRGHVFSDANKRTALVTALTYLENRDITIEKSSKLEDIMVDVAQGLIQKEELADIFYTLAN